MANAPNLRRIEAVETAAEYGAMPTSGSRALWKLQLKRSGRVNGMPKDGDPTVNKIPKFRYASTTASLCAGLLLGASATADTILFPVVAVNTPNVTTLISVVNTVGNAPRLQYTYRYKPSLAAGVPNYSGTCDTATFSRNTSANDLVTFDASGTFNGGNALFGDPDVYGGGFALGQSGPNRAYLLVSHANSAGVRQDVGNNAVLSGEAIILDIATGAAWGYRGINDTTQEDYDFTAITSAVSGNRFTFFPLDEWTTRFFVTPVGASMDSANLQSLLAAPTFVDRASTTYPVPITLPTVTCTAGVAIEDLMDATTEAGVTTSGGWSALGFGGPAVVYKLEYVVDDPTYGGTNNNAFLLSETGGP